MKQVPELAAFDGRWKKSSRSSPSGDNCVEVAVLPDGVAVRDSKNPTGGTLRFTPDEWDAFLGGAADGEFDLPTA